MRAGQRDAQPRRPLVAALATATVIAACGGSGVSISATPARDAVPRGGTLRVVIPNLIPAPGPQGPGSSAALLDPQGASPTEAAELSRCCLARTLLAHRGVLTDQGGAVLLPDLAESLPAVSPDALTWTFHLRRGVHYGPPLQSVEVTSPDFVRALERTAKLPNNLPLYEVIAGFHDYETGQKTTIAGLEVPDDHTLVVRLDQPAGDLGDRFTAPLVAPIPPLPGNPQAPFGVATGHDGGDSGFLVSTGPFMLEGSEKLDFSLPPQQQRPASGFNPDKLITLVRNPSWSPSSDPLRPAYVDRIEITPGGNVADAAAGIDAGRYDLMMFQGHPPQPPLAQITAYRSNPSLGHVDIASADSVRSIEFNVAVPPFDDLRVRRAMNYLVDKQRILDILGGSLVGSITGHVAIDSLENDALTQYDPYRTTGEHGSIDLARKEIAQSGYDSTHSGVCDASVCKHVPALVISSRGAPEVATEIAAEAARIGIGLNLTVLSPDDFFTRLLDPSKHVPLAIIVSWNKDYLNAEDFFAGQFLSSDITAFGSDSFMLGASPEQLRGYGYTVTQVPSIDSRIDECSRVTGEEQLRCWTALDQYVMLDVVPAVPLIAEHVITVVPKRVLHFTNDQLFCLPALDQIGIQH